MLAETLSNLFDRDLERLNLEISTYRNEDNLWQTEAGISNSAGNLCLHLLGNLNHFIGAVLGRTGYVRHRDDEFSLRNIPRQDLLLNIENCRLITGEILSGLTTGDMEKDYPLEFQGRILSTFHMLTHLLAHLNYHLGQINYHRRLLEK